ncbi:MAG: hypothetical protein HYV09_32820 [Deltaproteobacteria bacterium]|nr:hypothetical protein [Deltaproteobacteria bacterium]
MAVGALVLSPLVASAQATKAKPAASAATATSAAPAPSAPAASAAASVPAASAAPAGTLATGTTGTMDQATYSVRLRDLEQRINELKEQIRRSHTRLALLSESILSGITAAAKAEVVFENEMSSAFRLKRIVALYDGSPLATKTDEKDNIGDMKEIPLYNELVQPGDHTLQVLIEYQGNGYGIFSYLKGYKFEVRSSRSFTAIEGKTIQLRVIGYEQGGPTTPIEEKPAVRFTEKYNVGVGAAGAKKPETK